MNNLNNNGMGIYTAQSQFELDISKLVSLGFTEEEISILKFVASNSGKVTINEVVKYGVTYDIARRIKYLYDIYIGKVQIENTDDICKHMRKLHSNVKRIGIADLAVSKINKVPRKAVVAGIKDQTFSIYNSNRYKGEGRQYEVVDVTQTRILVVTNRRPVLKYKQPKLVEGVVEIKNINEDGTVTVAFNKEYAKLCNRFIIVASLRKPEMHLGLIEIICIEGTKVYVYAKTLGTRETVQYSMGTQRVYDYGFYDHEIGNKVKAISSGLYKRLCGVYATVIPANQDFRLLTIEESSKGNEIEIED